MKVTTQSQDTVQKMDGNCAETTLTNSERFEKETLDKRTKAKSCLLSARKMIGIGSYDMMFLADKVISDARDETFAGLLRIIREPVKNNDPEENIRKVRETQMKALREAEKLLQELSDLKDVKPSIVFGKDASKRRLDRPEKYDV